ncbi:response regulator [bacterium]|nr:response regulator [bacterium]
MPILPGTLKAKFLSLHILLIVGVSAVLYFYLPSHFKQQSLEVMKLNSNSYAEMVGTSLGSMNILHDKERTADLFQRLISTENLLYAVVIDSSRDTLYTHNFDLARRTGDLKSFDPMLVREAQNTLQTYQAITRDGVEIGRLYLGFSMQPIELVSRNGKRMIGIVSLVVLVIGGIGAWLISLVVTVPLSRMVTTAERITKGDFQERMEVDNRDEVGQLAQAMNRMLDELNHIYSAVEKANELLQAKAEERTAAWQASEEKYKSIVENSLEGIFVIQDGIIQFCNRRFAEIFGYDTHESIEGKNFENIIDEPSLQEVNRQLAQLESGHSDDAFFHFIGLKNDEKHIEIETRCHKTTFRQLPAIQGFLLDVTEQKDLERQLLHAQKMDAIGQLAAGAAHDFNNSLTVITGNAQIAMMELPEDDPVRGYTEEILSASHRASILTRQLLVFSRNHSTEPKILQVNSVLEEMSKMLKRIIGENIIFNLIPGHDLWHIHMDPAKFEQVIFNLVINARDAMAAGGRLTIETGNTIVEDADEKTGQKNSEREFIAIRIKDDGIGMSEKVRQQIFDPYFTTKRAENARGLGLSTTFTIVRQMDGFVEVESVEGEGTTFSVFLPRVREDLPRYDKERLPKDLPRGNETVLVVEDEDSVRLLITRILQGQGYNVIQAASGIEAYSLCHGNRQNIELLITDMIMPQLDGLELSDRLQRLYPKLRVVFMSGYALQTLQDKGFPELEIDFLKKPFEPIDLIYLVRNALDSST